MNPHASFRAAVLADPDDDLPRLIYADWLDERGDPLGEFIRLQIGAARHDSFALTASARHRQHQLLDLYRDHWLGDLEPIVYHAEFHRGFVENVILRAEDFVRSGGLLSELAPVQQVTLLGAGPVMAQLARCAHLKSVRSLHLTGSSLRDTEIDRLTSSEHIDHLSALRLGSNCIGSDGVSALARCPQLAGLRQLVLRNNFIGDWGAKALSVSPILNELTELDLAGNEIGPTGLDWLHRATGLPALRKLDVAEQREASAMFRAVSA